MFCVLVAVLMDKGIIIGVEHEVATRMTLPFVMFRHNTSVRRSTEPIDSPTQLIPNRHIFSFITSSASTWRSTSAKKPSVLPHITSTSSTSHIRWKSS